MKLILYGEASKREIKQLNVSSLDNDLTLMDFLLKNGIPVASSCGGEGICQKCVVIFQYQKILSCQKLLHELFIDTNSPTLSFSYL